MSEKRIYKGRWFLPQTPDNKVSGELSISCNKEATLELDGQLIKDIKWDTIFDPTIINGLTNDGKEITLYKCYLTHSSQKSAGYLNYTFSVETVFIGVHFRNENTILFKGISVIFTNLDDWVNRRDFIIEHETQNKYTVSYNQSQSVVAFIEDYKFQVVINVNTSRGCSHLNITQKAKIDFSSEYEKSFDEQIEFLRCIQNFLSLAMGVPTYPLEISGKTDAHKEILSNGNLFYKPIEIVYCVAEWVIESETTHWFHMLFTLPDVQERLELLLKNWVEKANLLKPVYDLFFATRYNPHLYLESNFLNLVQAVETYHRRKYVGKYMTDDEYQQGLYKSLLHVLPQDLEEGFKQALKEGKLKYANEYSLRKRLQEIVDRIAPNISIGFMSSNRKTKEFVSKVHDTRNYLTHYTQELQSKAASSEELIKLTNRLSVIMEICLLEEMGFGFIDIREMLNRLKKYQHLLQ